MDRKIASKYAQVEFAYSVSDGEIEKRKQANDFCNMRYPHNFLYRVLLYWFVKIAITDSAGAVILSDAWNLIN